MQHSQEQAPSIPTAVFLCGTSIRIIFFSLLLLLDPVPKGESGEEGGGGEGGGAERREGEGEGREGKGREGKKKRTNV